MSEPCWSCAEGEPPAYSREDEGWCPQSERSCGHHTNESWETDECAWCGEEFADDNRYCDCGEMITNGSDKCLGCYLKEA